MSSRNIPLSLLDRVKKAMRMEESDFKEYLDGLEKEGIAYVKNLLFRDFEELAQENKDIFISFYIQYALYAKIEKDEISRDKLDFLNSYIEGFNIKSERMEKDKLNKISGGGIKFV